jgi:hypothetical protein
LVRKTLSNFRFGEYYSDKTRLQNLHAFLTSLLDHGYAGKAEAIGTDYQNLELLGIVRIEVVDPFGNCRFWMLKKDVIEDAISILQGSIPIQSKLRAANLSSIEGVVQARSKLNVN